MSETNPPTPPASGRHPQHPAELFLSLIVTLLTPMFLTAAGGDFTYARAAAARTLEDYRVQTHSDLLTVAKIIAFGIATLGSLTLSMAEDLPLTQILRLRASANATDRSEHRNRLTLTQPHPERPAAPSPEPEIDEAALAAAAEAMNARTAANLARFSTPKPTPAPHAPPPNPDISDAEKHYQATWAASAAAVAAETAAELPTLPPEERHSAAIWINVLNDIAKDFMDGNFPPRVKPGDLAAMMVA